MREFWDYTYSDTTEFVETYDEIPLWSAEFGLLLLKYVPLHAKQKVLDIGSGSGFPLLELAERLGKSCQCFGLDTWKNANARANRKRRNYGIENVEILEGSAENIPFGDESLDLIVSNLGINNFENPVKVFQECYRVLKPKGRIALTTNLNGHWKEFYAVFEQTLRQLDNHQGIEKLSDQQRHRGTTETLGALFTGSGFVVTEQHEEAFEMRFLNGSAFFRHHFVKLGWLSSWKDIIQPAEWASVFCRLEENLNAFAESDGGLRLTVPMVYMEGEKI